MCLCAMGERSRACVLGVSILPLSAISILDFVIVPTMVNLSLHCILVLHDIHNFTLGNCNFLMQL